MNVADKINYLLEEKGISKTDFAQKLILHKNFYP